jgi:hypothetical protein
VIVRDDSGSMANGDTVFHEAGDVAPSSHDLMILFAFYSSASNFLK